MVLTFCSETGRVAEIAVYNSFICVQGQPKYHIQSQEDKKGIPLKKNTPLDALLEINS